MKRRHWLAAGCAQCAALGTASWWPGLASAQPEPAIDWQAPARFTRPDVASDEGGTLCHRVRYAAASPSAA